MYACLEGGRRLPPAAKGGHREREYCSSRCRQRAYRKQKRQTQVIQQLIEGEYLFPSDRRVTRDQWRFEREGLVQRYKLLEAERNTAQAELKFLQSQMALLEDDLHLKRYLLAEKEAEIVRLQTWL